MSPRHPHGVARADAEKVQRAAVFVDVLDQQEDLHLPKVLRIDMEELRRVRLQRLVRRVEQVDAVEDRQAAEIAAHKAQDRRVTGQRHDLGVEGPGQLRRGHEQLARVVAARPARAGKTGARFIDGLRHHRPRRLVGDQHAAFPLYGQLVEGAGLRRQSLQEPVPHSFGVRRQAAAQREVGEPLRGGPASGDRAMVRQPRPRLGIRQKARRFADDRRMHVGRGGIRRGHGAPPVQTADAAT